jgi:hypothetical protein
MKTKIRLLVILIVFFSLNIYSANNLGNYPKLNIQLSNEVLLMLPVGNEVDMLTQGYNQQKRYDIEANLKESYKEMWSDFEKNGKNSLPYCIYDAFNKFKEQKSAVTIKFSLTSWWDQKVMAFPSGNQSCFTAAGEYFPDDPEANPTIYRGLYIFCIWEKFYDGKICTKALLFHELLHYALDQVRRKAEYIQIKNEFSVNIFKAPNTKINNLYSDEAVVEDCELKLFGCGPDGYKHVEEEYKKNGARRFNPSENDDCKLCELCKNK